MKRDSHTGRYMITGRDAAGKSGQSYTRVRSTSGEIVVVDTERASRAFGHKRDHPVPASVSDKHDRQAPRGKGS